MKDLGMLECLSTCLQILSLAELCLFFFSFQFAPSILEEFLPFLDYMIRDQYIPWPHSAAPCTSPSSRRVSPRRVRVSLCCSCGHLCGEPSWACWIIMNGTALSFCMTQIEVSCGPAFLPLPFRWLLQELCIFISYWELGESNFKGPLRWNTSDWLAVWLKEEFLHLQKLDMGCNRPAETRALRLEY